MFFILRYFSCHFPLPPSRAYYIIIYTSSANTSGSFRIEQHPHLCLPVTKQASYYSFTPPNIHLYAIKVRLEQPLHSREEKSSHLSRDIFTTVTRPLHNCEEVVRNVLLSQSDTLFIVISNCYYHLLCLSSRKSQCTYFFIAVYIRWPLKYIY